MGSYDVEKVKENWYKSLPYAFETNIAGVSERIYLPINPSNLTISTHYATTIITTLGGTVEEHSDQRYFDISISGTTGIGPKYTPPAANLTQLSSDLNKQVSAILGKTPKLVSPNTTSRSFYGDTSFISGGALGGFFADKIAKVNKIANSIKDVVSSVTGKPVKPHESGITLSSTGYYAFHKLYLFFNDYKKNIMKNAEPPSLDLSVDGALNAVAGAVPGGKAILDAVNKKNPTTPLSFINYKDNNKYSCIINKFTLTRDIANPMLYNYSIQLRGYNLQPIEKQVDENLEDRLSQLGLSKDGPSALARIKKGMSGVRGALNGAKSIIGR